MLTRRHLFGLVTGAAAYALAPRAAKATGPRWRTIEYCLGLPGGLAAGPIVLIATRVPAHLGPRDAPGPEHGLPRWAVKGRRSLQSEPWTFYEVWSATPPVAVSSTTPPGYEGWIYYSERIS